MLRLIMVFLALSVTSLAGVGKAAANECDRLAAHPYDPAGTAQGVAFDAIDPVQAPMSCAAAYAAQPDDVRYKYQYGRALLAAKRPVEAMILIRAAARSGYAAAQQTLATILHEDGDRAKDRQEAIRLFHAAAAQGHAVAQLQLTAYYLGAEDGQRDLAKARRFARRAAERGLPAARKALEIMGSATIARN